MRRAAGSAPGRLGRWRVPAQLLTAQLVVLGGSFVANVITARAIGPSGRGEIALLLQASYLIAVFAILGRDRSYPALVSRKPIVEALADQVRLAALPVGLACVASALVVVALGGPLDLGPVDVALLAGLCIGAVSFRLTRAASIVAHQSRPFIWSAVCGQVILLGGLAWLWHGGDDATSRWALAYVVASALPYALLAIVPASRRIGQSRAEDVRVRYAGIAFPTIAEMMVMRLDRVLLPVLASYSALGLYIVVASIAEITSWPAQQFADSRITHWSRPDVTVVACLREARAVLVATLAVVGGGAVVIWVFLEPLFGTAYAPARSLVLPLSLAAVGVAAYRLTFSIVIAKRLAFAKRVQGVVAAALVVALYPWMIATWQAEGAAWATVLALAIAAVVPLCLRQTWRQKSGVRERPDSPATA